MHNAGWHSSQAFDLGGVEAEMTALAILKHGLSKRFFSSLQSAPSLVVIKIGEPNPAQSINQSIKDSCAWPKLSRVAATPNVDHQFMQGTGKKRVTARMYGVCC